MSDYVWGQLQRALTTETTDSDPATRTRAKKRAASWLRVLKGISTGAVRIGSRVPVAGFPEWLTPEIVRGGFATGAASAGGPLAEDEVALARRIGIKEDRAHLFAWFLSDAGLELLGAWLDSGLYRIHLPEHGALLAVAHLLRAGQPDAAHTVLGEIEPWADHIRFWPFEDAAPEAAGVHVATLSDVAGRLAAKRPRPGVEAEREALAVWAPFTDRVVEHWWCTRADPDGVGSVFPDGWDAGAQDLLAEYAQLAATHTLTTKHADPKGNLQILLAGLQTHSPSQKRARQGEGGGRGSLAAVRHAVACVVVKRGEPGSAKLVALRAGQSRIAALPSHAELAQAVATEIASTGIVGAVADPESIVAHTPGAQLPSVSRVLRQATQAPLADLLRSGIVQAAESLAVLAPQLTAETVAARYSDPSAGTLAKRVYLAFANRRSVLLVNHQSQVAVGAIPWFAALEQAGADGSQSLACAQARDLATLALRHFAGTALPNSLIRELTRLYVLAEEDVPLTFELAADIFMGSFNSTFLRAAQEAADVVGNTVYSTYYSIDYAVLSRMGTKQIRWGRGVRRTVPDFDALAHARAGVSGLSRSWSPARNGKVIEQAQILTTHNLAVLLRHGVDLDAAAQARSAWAATKDHLSKFANGRRLRHRKNAAIAWRQTLCFLSQVSPDEVARFLDEDATVTGLADDAAHHARAMIRGLRDASAGDTPRSGPFLGWIS